MGAEKPLERVKMDIKSDERSISTYAVDAKNYSDVVSYVTDIHLLHRYEAWKCKTKADRDRITDMVVSQISENDPDVRIKLIGGDVSSDYDTYRLFVSKLGKDSNNADYFFTLGNHELWPFEGEDLDSIVEKYRELLEENGMRLVHNNLFYYDEDDSIKEITRRELSYLGTMGLRIRLRNAKLVIFGGMGFSGRNEVFNANQGIYRKTISRKQEIKESKKIDELYNTVISALFDKSVIVLTHMPMEDWAKDNIKKREFVYVSGHNHKDYYFDDGVTRIYADNQIGYTQKNVTMKHLSVDMDYDRLRKYPDGIHIINRDDYIKFYRSINECVRFRRDCKKIYMLKREGVYMFFMESANGTLYILNGGSIKKEENRSLEYYYEHLITCSQSIKLYLSQFNELQKRISEEVKELGGSGYVHGCIVDFDGCRCLGDIPKNHLYINPIDWSITSYYANDMVDKYVYKNVPSLLKNKCPELYSAYKKRIANKNASELILASGDLTVSNKTTFVGSTEMYRISRIVRGLQYTTKHNVVRLWNDSIAETPSEENGKLLVTHIINPRVIEERSRSKVMADRFFASWKREERRRERRRETDPTWQKKEAEYKAEVAKITPTIEVLKYRGTVRSSEYQCKLCGHNWKQYYQEFDRNPICPNCKK